jgi:hypothetical protein
VWAENADHVIRPIELDERKAARPDMLGILRGKVTDYGRLQGNFLDHRRVDASHPTLALSFGDLGRMLRGGSKRWGCVHPPMQMAGHSDTRERASKSKTENNDKPWSKSLL